MAQITFLGTAASIPSADRDNTAFLFAHRSRTILVDCPGALTHKLLKAGVNVASVTQVIVTHRHVDHIYGLIDLLHCQMRYRNTLTIYSTPVCIRLIKKSIRLFKLDGPKFGRVRFVDVLNKEYFYSSGGIKIKAFRNTHIPGSFAVGFYWDSRMLGYSSDTALCETLLREFNTCDYLIHECLASSHFFKKHPSLYTLHTDAKTLAARLKDTPIKTVIPVHFLLTEKDEERKIIRELAPLGKKLRLVKDFQSVDFKR